MSAVVPVNPLEALPESLHELLLELGPLAIAGDKAGEKTRVLMSDPSLTTFTLWFFIAFAITMLLVFAFKKKQRENGIVPKGRFVNLMEMAVEFVQNSIVADTISHDGKRHVPFVSTVFFFVLVNNLLGLVPGFKAGTGVIAGTAAIAIFVFFYFNYFGLKEKGFLGYFGGLVPPGVPKVIAPLIWVIELVSLLLRPITQALRLFANMFAGHIMLGIFAILTELFIRGAIAHVAPLTALPAIIWFLFLTVLYVLEIVVAVIQAYVFALLTSVYVGMATSKEH